MDLTVGADAWQEMSSELRPEERVAGLERELAIVRGELDDARRELAARAVQLSRHEQSGAQAGEAAAVAAAERDRRLAELNSNVAELQAALSKRDHELEEAQRLYASQKKVLKEALANANDREAAARDADEASRAAVVATLEEEVDTLSQELIRVKARSRLELAAKEGEINLLSQQLAAANAVKKKAVAEAEKALTAAWKQEAERMAAEANARSEELAAELSMVRLQQSSSNPNSDAAVAANAAAEAAAARSEASRLQREFDVYRDLISNKDREKREQMASLLEENAALKARIASEAAAAAMAGVVASSSGAGVNPLKPKTFDRFDRPPAGGWPAFAGAWLERLHPALARLEARQRGAVPMLLVALLAALFLTLALARASAFAIVEHSDSSWSCFWSKLGLGSGSACSGEAAAAALAQRGGRRLLLR